MQAIKCTQWQRDRRSIATKPKTFHFKDSDLESISTLNQIPGLNLFESLSSLSIAVSLSVSVSHGLCSSV